MNSNIPNVAETCLCLQDFPVKARGVDYQVTVELYADELEHGYVTENKAFIEAVQNEIDVLNSVQLAQRIIEIAQQRIGRRLTRVAGAVYTPSPSIQISYTTPRSLLPLYRHRTHMPGHFEMKGYHMSVKLIRDGVCGGYDGEFKYDLVLDTQQKISSDLKVHRRIERKFEGKIWKGSCEELANALVHGILRYGYKVYSIRARVYNNTGWVEVIWLDGMAVPLFLMEAPEDSERAPTAYYDPTNDCCAFKIP